MSDYEEEDILRMFSEIMSSNALEQEEDKKDTLDIKSLLIIQESIMDTLMSINSIIYRMHTKDKEDTIPEGLEELLGNLYGASEKFFLFMSQNDGIILSSEDENEEDKDLYEDEEDEEE